MSSSSEKSDERWDFRPEAELPVLQPLKSRTVMERRDGGFRITLPSTKPSDFAGKWCFWALGISVVATFVLLVIQLRFLPGQDPQFALLLAAGLGWPGLIFLLSWVEALRTRSTIHVTADTLVITCRVWQTRRWEWQRGQIDAIVIWQGLWVVSPVGRERFFAKCPQDDLQWIGSLVRRYLEVPGHLPRNPDDLPVVVRGCYWITPLSVALRVLPGRMIVTHPVASHPLLDLRPRKEAPWIGWSSLRRFFPLSVSPLDISCRVSEDGSACLLIRPLGADFVVRIRCTDGAALEKALARFWGAAE
jgi:hypothetical protein